MADELKVAGKEIETLTGAIKLLAAQLGTNISSSSDKAKSAILDYNKAIRESSAFLKKNSVELNLLKKNMDGAVQECKDLREAEGKLNDALKNQNKVLEGSKKAYGALASSTKSFISSAAKMGSIVGVGTFSFQAIFQAALDYNQSLGELSLAQQSAGKDTTNLRERIGSLTKGLTKSNAEFAEFAKNMTLAFVGVPPNIDALKRYAEIIQTQVGPSTKAQSDAENKLISIMASAPMTYDAVTKAMEKAANATKKGVVLDPKKVEASVSAISALAYAEGIEIKQRQELIALTAQANKETQDGWEQQNKAAEVTKYYKDTMVELGSAAMPVFEKIADAAKWLLGIIEKSPVKVMALVGAFAGLQQLAPFAPLLTGGFKMVGMLGKLNPSFLGLSGSALKASSSMVKFGAAGAVAASGLAGWQVGKWMDEFLGISDVVAKVTGALGNEKIFKKNKGDTQKFLDDLQKQYKDVDVEDLYKQLGGDVGKQKYSVALSLKMELDKSGGDAQKVVDTWKENVDTQKKLAEGAKNITKQEEALKKGLDGEKKPLDYSQRAYDELEALAISRLKLINMSTKALGAEADMAEQMGRVDKEALAAKLSGLQQEYENEQKLVDFRAEAASKKYNIKAEDGTEGLEKAMSIQKQMINYAKTLAVGSDERKEAEADIANISKVTEGQAKRKVQLSDESYNVLEAEMRQQEQYTSKYEARLSTEKKLMESAQFGMGASVEMMQKQVALLQQQGETYARLDEAAGNKLVTEGKITESELEQLKGMKSQKDANDYVVNVLHKKDAVAGDLLRYAAKHQDYTDKEMQQQQKIYEITKDVREGYLDAMVEMAAGAGEFSKIIGTQDKGVTQLMQSVKDTTGEDRLNTMALGGITARGAESGRREVTGQFTSGGVRFKGKEAQEQANKDVYGYKKEYNAGTTVGTASVGTKEVKAAYEAGDNGTRSAGSAVNTGVGKGEFSGFNYQDHKANLMKLSTESAVSAQGQPSASGVQTLSPGKPYAGGGNTVKLEVKLIPTGELSKYIDATTEIITSVIA